jgi:SAM-dependent methyltransferase
VNCPTCDEPGTTVSGRFDGYIEGYQVAIVECGRCGLRYADRLDVPGTLYESIYRHAAVLPGYDRYARYARAVTRSADPLATLAGAELPYRFAADAVKLLPGDATVIDLGCGEGYLTYALRRAGFSCVGVDLSQTVVDRARRRFGHDDWFATPDELAESRADLVIALELIEHVPDPVGFLRDAKGLLRDGGTIVMTTPNRDASPADAIWDTDLPPVHLLWFGQKAITEVARMAGCDVAFLDAPHHAEGPKRAGTWEPLLTADGRPSKAVRRVRGLPWRLRNRAGRALLTGGSPFRALPARAEAPAPTLGVAFRPQRVTAGAPRHAAPASPERVSG